LGALWTAGAQAANAQASNTFNTKNLYFGAKVGLMMNDAPGFGDAINIGGIVGLPVTRLEQGEILLEGELTTTVVRGDVGYIGINGHWDVTTLAGYGVFRTYGPMYFKAKAGLLYEDASVSINGVSTYGGTDTGVSLGIGGGMRLSGGHSIELEYTIIDSDVNFLSIGYKF